MRSRFTITTVFLTATLSLLPAVFGRAGAEELLPPEGPIPQVIDHYIQLKLQQNNVPAAKPAADFNFVRRVTLDLAGRIPTSAEARQYVDSTRTDKKRRLVERLLESPDYAYHQRNSLDLMLMEAGGGSSEWRQYLLTAARENRPWDEMFREMMLGRDDDPEQKTALTFLKARANSLDDMTNDTSRIFFGVSINCAKCHDHPLVFEWLQDHYFGFASFFDRTYLTKKATLAEKYSGDLKFKTTDGKEKLADFMFLDGTTAEEPPVEKSAQQRKQEEVEVKRQMKDANAPPPKPPAFSPRSEFVKLALEQSEQYESSYFARSVVNRIWARLLGRGIVHPLDQMHSGNEASHPELLDWLTRDLIDHNYDLKRLIEGIVLCDAYARSSRWDEPGEPPAAELFAVAKVRPLTPRQYALSLHVATADPDSFSDSDRADDWEQRRESLENSADGFSQLIDRPTEHFLVSVDEALLFSNNERIERDFLRNAGDKLVGRLVGMSEVNQIIETACWAVCSRPPEAQEAQAMQDFLSARQDRREAGIQQMVWALITSPELRFNY